MQDVSAQLVTVGIALAVVAGAYLVDLLCALANIFRLSEFSWRKLGRGLAKCLLIAVGTAGFVAIINLLNWLTGRLNIDVSGILGDVSVVGLLGIVLTSSVKYLTNSYKNIQEFFLKGESSQLDTSNSNPDYQGIAEETKKGLETILGKSVKESLAEQGLSLEGEEIPVDEAGKGGINNTYPEPYRSAVQDTLLDPSSCYNRECVSYCAWKICEIRGSWPPRTGSMNAKDWIYRLPSWGYNQVNAPRNGGKYVGVSTAGTYGHVVWFEYDNVVSEYNYGYRGDFGVRAVNLSQYTWYEIQSPAPTPTPTPTDIKVGDTVTLKNWVDYNGTPLYKTRDYYFVSELNGDRAVLRADSMGGTVYAAANTSNLEKVSPSAPSDKPQIGDHVTTSALQDQNGTWLNLKIINDGNSIWAETNGLGNAVLRTANGTVRCGVPVDSLSKV